jgi:hypothetical protein
MRVEEFVGQHIRARLTELRMTHEDFGRRLEPYLGKAWSRSAVSVALSGGRAWTAAELVATAIVIGTTPGRLLTPPLDAATIEMPSGKQIPRAELIAALAPLTTQEAISTIQAQLAQVAAGSQSAMGQLRELDEVLSYKGQPEGGYQAAPVETYSGEPES